MCILFSACCASVRLGVTGAAVRRARSCWAPLRGEVRGRGGVRQPSWAETQSRPGLRGEGCRDGNTQTAASLVSPCRKANRGNFQPQLDHERDQAQAGMLPASSVFVFSKITFWLRKPSNPLQGPAAATSLPSQHRACRTHPAPQRALTCGHHRPQARLRAPRLPLCPDSHALPLATVTGVGGWPWQLATGPRQWSREAVR